MNGDDTISAHINAVESDQSAPAIEVTPRTMTSDFPGLPNLTIDPEFKDLIPPLDQGEREDLKKSIEKEGCRDKLVICELEGKHILLDGHNRYEICKELGIPFQRVEIKVHNRTEAKIWIIKNQRARRNLNESQRSMLAVKLEALYGEEAKQRKGKRTDLGQNLDQSVAGRSAEKAARDMGVSHQTVSFAKKVVKEGIPELKKMVESGDVAVSAAAKVTSRPSDVQVKIVENAATLIQEGKNPNIASLLREIDSKTPEIDAEELQEKFRKNLKADLMLLEGIETIQRPENLAEMLALAEKIMTRLKEIESKSYDPKIESQTNCVIELSHFKTFIESIVPVSEKANLGFDNDGVRARAACPSSNIMLEGFLPRSLFSRYNELGEIGLPDTTKLLGLLSNLSNKKMAGRNLLIYVEPGNDDKDPDKLHGLSGLNEIQCLLQDPSHTDDIKSQDSVSTCEVRVDGNNLVNALKQSLVLSKTAKFLVSEKFFRILSEDKTSGKGMAKGIAKPHCEVSGDGSADSTFAIDQLMTLTRTIEKSKDVTLSLGMSQPMIMDLTVDKMAIKYFIKEKQV